MLVGHPGARNSTPESSKPAPRPAVLTPQFDSIEQHLGELTGLPRWVLWKMAWRQGRWTKPPCTPAGRSASVEVPDTWSSYSDCKAAYEAGGHDFAGVGIVLDGSDDLVAVDLDKCLVDGITTAWATEALELLDPSYREVSPSGTGVRAFVRGKLPRPGMRVGGLELYSASRFMTVTGRLLPGVNA
jgi:putative DNA primase/helicase